MSQKPLICSTVPRRGPRPLRPGNRGTLLVLTAVALFMIAALTVGVLGITTHAIHTSDVQRDRASALNIAESGAELGALWLRDQPSSPSSTSAFDPFGGAQTMDSGTYQVTITPDPDNPTSFLKTFKIVAIGTACNVSKSVEIVVRQSSFGKFAYFTNSETSSVSGGAIWWKAGELVDGPVHSNNTSGSNFNINYNNSVSPIFLDMVTGSGSTINYNPSRPRDETTFKRIYLNGSKGYLLGVPRVELPDSTTAQKEAAWGDSSSYPSSTGVYLKAGSPGGIYIQGDCGMLFAVDGSGNQLLLVTQTVGGVPQTTTLTMNKATQTTSTSGPMGSGSPTSASSLPNGVVYCTGNVTTLCGIIADNKVSGATIDVRNEWTVATDVNAGKDIKITNNLVYNTKPDKTKDSSDHVNLAAGTLGLVARNITISSSAPANLEIDAVCMAGSRTSASGSFSVQNYDSKTPVGTLKVIGGIIQKNRGPVGTFNSSTGVTTTGYSKNYVYDPRLAQRPPPYYPTTGQYERISWRVLPDN